jgi:hypothetical protein
VAVYPPSTITTAPVTKLERRCKPGHGLLDLFRLHQRDPYATGQILPVDGGGLLV